MHAFWYGPTKQGDIFSAMISFNAYIRNLMSIMEMFFITRLGYLRSLPSKSADIYEEFQNETGSFC